MKPPKKATVHVSIDPVLAEKLRRVCQTMGLPISHFTSLALSREVARFEAEFCSPRPPGTVTGNA